MHLNHLQEPAAGVIRRLVREGSIGLLMAVVAVGFPGCGGGSKRDAMHSREGAAGLPEQPPRGGTPGPEGPLAMPPLIQKAPRGEDDIP